MAISTFAIAADAPATNAAILAKDFGWSKTNIAGKAAGEIGGTISSSSAPVRYADKIEAKTIKDKLMASGVLSLPEGAKSQAAVLIGWFNSKLEGWHDTTCIGFRVHGDDDGTAPGGAVYTYANGGSGVAATGFQIPRDGKRHTWSLSYDPTGNNGNGTITFVLDSQKPFIAKLPVGLMAKDAAFDRFGVLQVQADSVPFSLYLDDLQYGNKTQDFSADPGWEKGGGPASLAAAGASVRSTQPSPQDALNERIKVEPNGALSFYTKHDGKLQRSFLITPEGHLVAGGVSRSRPQRETPQTNEPPAIDAAEYDNARGGDRLSWVNDFYLGMNKKLGFGKENEGQPMLYIRVLGLFGRGDSPDIQLGRAGPDNAHTSYGPLEDTLPGMCLGKVIFKAYSRKAGWTGDIAGIYARNETTPTKEKSPASLHFNTAGESTNGNPRSWFENIERMVIKSNGYVAIGDAFAAPTERLHVKGNIRAEGDIVATRAKKFVINHPTQPGKQLVHAAIEGPETAVYYRGEGQLIDGQAEIRLPEYFEALTAKNGRTVILTNVDGFDRLAVQRQQSTQVKDGRFVVFSDNTASTQAFSWEVKATRSDLSPLQVER